MELSLRFVRKKAVALLAICALVISGALVAVSVGATQSSAAGGNRSERILPTQGEVTWTAPEGVTNVNFAIQGGAGGKSSNTADSSDATMPGMRASGSFQVTPGQVVTFIAGYRGGTAQGDAPGTGGTGYRDGVLGSSETPGEYAGGGGGGSSAILLNDGADVFVVGGGAGLPGVVELEPSAAGAGGNFKEIGGSALFSYVPVDATVSDGYVDINYMVPPSKTIITVELSPASGHGIDGNPVAFSFINADVVVTEVSGEPVGPGTIYVTNPEGRDYGGVQLTDSGTVRFSVDITDAGPETFIFTFKPLSENAYEESSVEASVDIQKVQVRSTLSLPKEIVAAGDLFTVEADFKYGANSRDLHEGTAVNLHANPINSKDITGQTKTWVGATDSSGHAIFDVTEAPGDGWYYWVMVAENRNFQDGSSESASLEFGRLRPEIKFSDEEPRVYQYGDRIPIAVTFKSPRPASEPTVGLIFYLDGVRLAEPDRYAYPWDEEVRFYLDVPGGAPGEHTIEVEFPGDATFEPVTGITQTYVVEKAETNTIASHGNLLNEDTYTYGQPVDLWSVLFTEYMLNLGEEQGIQEFFVQPVGAQDPRIKVGSGELRNDRFPFFGGEDSDDDQEPEGILFHWSTSSVTNIPVGEWEVSADFLGNDNYQASTEPEFPLEELEFPPVSVTQAQTSTEISVPQDLVFNTVNLVSATVTSVAPSQVAPVGDVEFFLDGESLGTATLAANSESLSSAGLSTATFNLKTEQMGAHEITARYLGNENQAGSEATESVTYNVLPAPTVIELTATPQGVVVGDEVTFTAGVGQLGETADATLLSTGTVEFFVDGQSVGSPVEVVSGQAAFTWNAATVGTYQVTARFTSDDEKFISSESAQLEMKVGIPWTALIPSTPIPTPSPDPTDEPSSEPTDKPTDGPSAEPSPDQPADGATPIVPAKPAPKDESELPRTGTDPTLAAGAAGLLFLLGGLVIVGIRSRRVRV